MQSISGKLNRKENQVFYVKFGKNFVWSNKGVHTFNSAQIAAQTMLSQAAGQVKTIMASSTQRASYEAAF